MPAILRNTYLSCVDCYWSSHCLGFWPCRHFWSCFSPSVLAVLVGFGFLAGEAWLWRSKSVLRTFWQSSFSTLAQTIHDLLNLIPLGAVDPRFPSVYPGLGGHSQPSAFYVPPPRWSSKPKRWWPWWPCLAPGCPRWRDPHTRSVNLTLINLSYDFRLDLIKF